MQNKIGLWLIGARGSVATTVSLGLSGLIDGCVDECGLVSSLPAFVPLNLIDWRQVVIGGHDIRDSSLFEEAQQLNRITRTVDSALVELAKPHLNEIDQRICPGIVCQQGPAIERLATPGFARVCGQRSGRELIELIKQDFSAFSKQHQLTQVVVINVASTEPPADINAFPQDWPTFAEGLESGRFQLPSSSLYAIASFESGNSYVNFTPSLGSNFDALKDLAVRNSVCHVGQDGKTGETLVKSALAPMFAHRNLQVMSWVGHNIFGNLDAEVLDDPQNKQSKVQSKDRLLAEILGYTPQSHISIENISSMGDWKTAWDHIHFKGFLGTPMVMQFIWQGCDSILAAPLVLDLFRFTERATRDGQVGVLEDLACFFKSPMKSARNHKFDQAITAQFEKLLDWAAKFEKLAP